MGRAEVEFEVWAQVAERLMAADCKSAAPCELRRFESSPVHQKQWSGISGQWSERGSGPEVLGCAWIVCDFGVAGLVYDRRWQRSCDGQAGGDQAGSADRHRRVGVENGFGPASGEDPQERQLLAVSYWLLARASGRQL